MDHANKQQHQQKRDDQNKGVQDFGDNNVFSYIYSTKVHKSHAMAEKKDKVIDMMRDQFMNGGRD